MLMADSDESPTTSSAIEADAAALPTVIVDRRRFGEKDERLNVRTLRDCFGT